MEGNNVDFDLLPDVIIEVEEHLPALERDLHQLVATPDSGELLDSAFRHMHTIKGDFGYCHATPIMEYVHQLENVMQSLRGRQIACSTLVAEALLQSLDLIHDMMETLLATRAFGPGPSATLCRLIDKLAQTTQQPEADDTARRILLTLHGQWRDPADHTGNAGPAPSSTSAQHALALGQQLTEALAARNPAWQKRTALQLALVQALNEQYTYPTDPTTLEIAVYWHDVGLLGAGDGPLQIHPQQKAEHWADYVAHTEKAANWLLCIAPDCTEAAQIIRQHHAWANGKGIVAPQYPLPVHQGAQMLACADFWFERIKDTPPEEFRRAMLRVLFDINGLLDIQFDALLNNAFESLAHQFQLPALPHAQR